MLKVSMSLCIDNAGTTTDKWEFGGKWRAYHLIHQFSTTHTISSRPTSKTLILKREGGSFWNINLTHLCCLFFSPRFSGISTDEVEKHSNCWQIQQHAVIHSYDLTGARLNVKAEDYPTNPSRKTNPFIRSRNRNVFM